MEIDNYRNFLAIVEAGSMTSASEFVHIAQPALSKQLKSLEGYFGTKLIITTRGSKHLILTDAGKILYHKAKYICSLEDMARIEIDDISDGNRGTLRISAANSRSSIFIKTCLEPFHDLFPNVVYEIYEGSVNEQSQQLLSGITELGILSVPLIHQNDFEILFQREEDICAIFSKNSKFLTDIGDKETVSIKDLASLPLCASAGCNLIMNKIFKAHNLKPNILSICTTRTAALQWAEDDYGVSLVPIEPGRTSAVISPAAVSKKPTQNCTKRWSRSKAVPSPSSRGSSSSSILKRAIPKEWESSARCCKEIQGLRNIMPTL